MTTRQQTKADISHLLQQHEQLYPSDIAQELDLDYELVVSILEELQREGAVAPVVRATGDLSRIS